MTFDPELMHMLVSVMVMTSAFEDGKCTDYSAVHLAEALWKQLRMYIR